MLGNILYLGKNLKKLKGFVWLTVFVLVLFVPMILEFVFLNDYAPVLRRVLSFWKNRSTILLLSDILFLEGGFFLIFGALFAGVILYNAWVPTDVRKAQFTEYIWNWKVISKERGLTTGALAGLIIIGVGLIYIAVAIVITN